MFSPSSFMYGYWMIVCQFPFPVAFSMLGARGIRNRFDLNDERTRGTACVYRIYDSVFLESRRAGSP